MVYLTILLTILISILVYTFDPAPDRSEHDIRAAEAYVLDFVNQHQAARDFMQHWMGYSKANTGSGVIISGDTTSRMENFMGNGLVTNMSSATEPGNWGGDTFKSAYLCLDDSWHLVREENCKKRYVVTYSNVRDGLSGRPDWWATRETDAISKGRWRRAIAQRTRGSYGCGVLTLPYEDGTGNWCYRTGVKDSLKQVQEDDCGDGNTGFYRKEKFCIDNGEGCKTLLPGGIKSFLMSELNTASDGDLSDMLVCISTVKDPYVTDGLVFQYDGINTSGEGAPPASWSDRDFNSNYRKKNGSDQVLWTDLVSSNNAILDNDASWAAGVPAVSPDSSNGNVLRSGFKLGTDSTFTLTVVAKIGNTGNTQTIIGPVKGNGGLAPGLVTPDSKKTPIALTHMSICPANSEAINGDCFLFSVSGPAETTPTAIRYELGNGTTKNDEIMSWTIVNRPERDGDRWSTSSYKAYLYNGPAPACKGQHADNVIAAEYQLDSGVTPNEMKLGGDNEIKVYAVRYYKRALTRREIHHNFLVDAKRYGISRWDTNNDNDTYKNEGGACEKWCEVDSDCLNTYEVCRSHSCTVVECRKNTDCENNETCNNGQCEAP